jgi:hypothetical protein
MPPLLLPLLLLLLLLAAGCEGCGTSCLKAKPSPVNTAGHVNTVISKQRPL